MVKKLFVLAFFFFGWIAFSSEEIGLGEEYIEPLKYPKLSLAGDYEFMRKFHGFGDGRLRVPLKNGLGGSIGIDIGLYKYLSAGVIFSSNIPQDFKATGAPLLMRFSLFAKPYIPITNRFSIFTRFGGGFSISAFNMLSHLRKIGNDDLQREIARTYQEQSYAELSPGANAMASVGLEFFPFSRFGLSCEWGIRAEYFYSSKGSALYELLGRESNSSLAPDSLNYLLYEMPLSLSLHIIL